jgi:DNA-directed RNA polymerase subunit RPC12/RpoP
MWYKCKNCGHEWHGGFFVHSGFAQCPKCWSKFLQVTGVIKKIIKIAILPGIAFVIIFFAFPALLNRISSHGLAALDSTTLYNYSKDAYLESVIRGRQKERFYQISNETPYYTAILSGQKLASTEPLGILPGKVIVELGSVIRKGGNAWLPASFYVQEKPQQAFALFPRDWEAEVAVYDWNTTVENIKKIYVSTITKNFELMEVEPVNEKDYKEKYNDYYKVREIGDGTFFYAPKTDKNQIDAIYSYYLSMNNKRMVILQTDKEWERPALEIKKTGEEE